MRTGPDTPSQCVPGNDVVFTSLPGPRDVEAVVLGENGILEGATAGDVYMDLSTNSPTAIRRIHDVCAEQGVNVLDSPVSGGVYGAAAATLAVMVGGDEAIFNRMKPTLDAIGSHVVYCGPIGNGMVCKICNNTLGMGIGVLMTEVLTLGVKAGVDLAVLADVIANSFRRQPAPGGEVPSLPVQGQLRARLCHRPGRQGRAPGHRPGPGVWNAHGTGQPG